MPLSDGHESHSLLAESYVASEVTDTGVNMALAIPALAAQRPSGAGSWRDSGFITAVEVKRGTGMKAWSKSLVFLAHGGADFIPELLT